MCDMAKHPICAMKFPQEPKRSPAAEKPNANIICHGHRAMDAMVSRPTGMLILCGISTGLKYIEQSAIKRTVTPIAIFVIDFSGMLKIIIMSNSSC